MSSATARLKQVASFLSGAGSQNEVVSAEAHPFRAKWDLSGSVSYSPLCARLSNASVRAQGSRNPINFLLRAAQVCPERVAVEHPERGFSWTYREWAWRVSDLAHALIARGVKPGDRVAVLAPNVPLILDATQAIPAARAIIVPLNTRLTKPEINYILEHSGAVLLLVDSALAELASDAKCPVIVADDRLPDGDAYEQLLRDGRKAGGEEGFSNLTFEPDEHAGIALNYTSGTTGRPKGCLTTYRGAYLAATTNVIESRMTRESTYLWILPAFHASGWTFPWAITAAMCGQICLRQVGDGGDIWNLLRRKERSVTHYCAAPTVNVTILNHPSAKKLPISVCVNIAGAAPTPKLIAGLEELNIQVTHVYGLTETYGPITRLYEHPEWQNLGADEVATLKARQGQSFYAADEALVVKPQEEGSESNRLVEVKADGKEVGEIIFRGNIVMKEYYNDPEATAKAFAGGFFHTGDLAVKHPDGAIAIQDRSKDIIISGGENASSLAIEAALAAHPSIREVAVVARPHEKYGERAHAFVVLHPDKQNEADGFEAELKRFSRDKLPGFARPEWVEVVDDLPKTSTGKIRKNTLRDQVKKL